MWGIQRCCPLSESRGSSPREDSQDPEGGSGAAPDVKRVLKLAQAIRQDGAQECWSHGEGVAG